ncbi:MAG: hypothetical protein ABFD79_06190 [Phycisphaerales bacterium]
MIFHKSKHIKSLKTINLMMYEKPETNKYAALKSRGEREIARFLDSQNIAYQYEYPMAIKDWDKVRVVYPDFRLPDYQMVIEYFGMNGDAVYNEQTLHKILSYKEAGIDGIYLLESSLSGNWQEQVLAKIEQSLEGKLNKINSCRSAYHPTTREH